MESGQITPAELKKKRQAGQTLVEFILLLLVIVMVSFGFLRVANGNLGRLWETYVRLIVDDPGQNGAITIP
jgi:hypothetical protein